MVISPPYLKFDTHPDHIAEMGDLAARVGGIPQTITYSKEQLPQLKNYASTIVNGGGITFRINPQNVLLGGTRNYGSEFFSNTFFSGDTVIGLLHTGKESVRKPEIPT